MNEHLVDIVMGIITLGGMTVLFALGFKVSNRDRS